jgi:hypothetical protein
LERGAFKQFSDATALTVNLDRIAGAVLRRDAPADAESP